jgi:hypothetical protein
MLQSRERIDTLTEDPGEQFAKETRNGTASPMSTKRKPGSDWDKPTEIQFQQRARACELAAEFLRSLAHKEKQNAPEILRIAQWNERRAFWWAKKAETLNR